MQEMQELHARGEKNNIVINECWNVIRQIVEMPSFMPVYYDEIEN